MKKPEQSDVESYFRERGSTKIEAEKFFDYFESVGWRVGGRAPMKDWQAASRNWIRNAQRWSPQTATVPKVKLFRCECGDMVLEDQRYVHLNSCKNFKPATKETIAEVRKKIAGLEEQMRAK